ncbi:MAG: hypothetical protein ACOH5I_06710 [Oligoflexus sp.]
MLRCIFALIFTLFMTMPADASEPVDLDPSLQEVESDDGLRDWNEYWTCRADATDGTGVFFLGMGRTRADAYVRALETCSRMNKHCRITCHPEILW